MEQERLLDREVETDDPVTEVTGDQSGASERTRPGESAGSTGGLRQRLRRGAGRIVSARGLALALVLVIAGVVVLGGVVPVVGEFVGVLVAAFCYGAVTDRGRYLELAAAGGLAGGASALLGNLALTVLGPGLALVAVGAGGGVLAALVGHYFGRDLRDGLTRDLS